VGDEKLAARSDLPLQPASEVTAGSANWKTAPRGWFGMTQIRPPWATGIERLMDSPIPIPSDFVVKKRSKIVAAP